MCVNPRTYKWPVGETVNTSASQADTHGFEPRTGHHLRRLGLIQYIKPFLFALCGLFFLFKAMFFKTKLINEHFWSFNLLTIS